MRPVPYTLPASRDLAHWRSLVALNGWSVIRGGEGWAERVASEAWSALRCSGEGYVPTPLLLSRWLTERAGRPVYLKLESEQITGSFKARGAAHKIQTLCSSPGAAPAIVTASTGNHALAVLHACAACPGAPAPIIFVPETVSASKAERLRSRGARLVVAGATSLEAEERAREHADESQAAYVSPYNDSLVAGGQGTVAIELLAALEAMTLDVFVPVGGGGLMSGVASVLRGAVGRGGARVRLVGCEPAASDAMQRAVRGEAPLREYSATLSDGTAGGVESGSLTVEVCGLVDEWVAVKEEDIARAMMGALNHDGKLVEGAAGVALAAALQAADAGTMQGDAAVVVVCGGNVGRQAMERAMQMAA